MTKRQVTHIPAKTIADYPRPLQRMDAVQDAGVKEFLDATRWALPDLVAARNYYSDEYITLHYTFHCNMLCYVNTTIYIRWLFPTQIR